VRTRRTQYAPACASLNDLDLKPATRRGEGLIYAAVQLLHRPRHGCGSLRGACPAACADHNKA